MATGSSASAADEALRTTDEKANFQRLTRLLMRGGLTLLREVFDSIHPPASLPAVLLNPTIKSNLKKTEGKESPYPTRVQLSLLPTVRSVCEVDRF